MTETIEQLREYAATEIMGATLTDDGRLYRHDEPVFAGYSHLFVSQWQPDTDLNQLAEVVRKVREKQTGESLRREPLKSFTPYSFATRPCNLFRAIVEAHREGK